ncbi:MAG: nucleoside 2-deoxyribosyltransferase [Methylocystaceae bacterium]|nr:nucleoside 2-deoxyribosyltransferase [Methylocystaceae bacterium]
MTKRIYLAGPGVFYPDPIAEGERLKVVCQDFGLEGVFPMDAGLDISTMTKQEAAQAIYQANIDLIHSCDGVMADMQPFRGPGMDGGTAFEIGYAKALGLPVVGYNTNGLYHARTVAYYNHQDPTCDPKGLTIEEFGLVDNLMMACGVDVVLGDEKQVCAWFINHFEAD